MGLARGQPAGPDQAEHALGHAAVDAADAADRIGQLTKTQAVQGPQLVRTLLHLGHHATVASPAARGGR